MVGVRDGRHHVRVPGQLVALLGLPGGDHLEVEEALPHLGQHPGHLRRVTEAGHGGGDGRLVEDFIKYLTGEETSISCTSLEDSIYGHLAVYKADESREKGQAVELTLR